MIPLFAAAMVAAVFAWFVLRGALHNRVQRQLAVGDVAGVLRVSRLMTRLYPRDAQVYRGRAQAYMQSGLGDAALADYAAALERSPRDLALRLERAFLYAALGRFDAAAAEYETLANISPDDPQVIVNRAWLHLKRGDLDTVEQDLAQAADALAQRRAALTPVSAHMGGDAALAALADLGVQVENLRGMLLTRRGDTTAAAEVYERILAAHPDQAAYFNDAAEASFSAGRLDVAQDYYERARTLALADDAAAVPLLTGFSLLTLIEAGLAVTHYARGQADAAMALWQVVAHDDVRFSDAAALAHAFNWPDAMLPPLRNLMLAAQALPTP